MSTVNEPGTVAEPSVTFTIPARTVSVTIPSQSITLPARSLVSNTQLDMTALVAAVAAALTPTTPTPVVPPPVSVPSSNDTFWVYKDGVFNWGGDYSFAASPNYKDSQGSVSPELDIAVTITGPWGGFLPFAGGTVPQWNFDDSTYNFLVFDFKPTLDNQRAQVYFVKVGDVPVGVVVDPFSGKYGPKPVKGVWGSYKIPLADLGVAGTSVYKFAIQDQTGLVGHTMYLDNIGFTSV